MIRILDDSRSCCGCSACYNVCPKNCITMKENREGFLYPEIGSECVECGMCKKVCPVINSVPEIEKDQFSYAVQNKNKEILQQSTSGGAFTAIAEYIIEKEHGIVFGAAFDDSLTVSHIRVENKSELSKFRNSKYVQSNIGTSFKEAKYFLDEGRTVCFSGTPCQIEGLKCYLQHDYDNLITVDVVCHSVPSPMIFRKYLEMQSAAANVQIKEVRFRDKYFGYKYSTMTLSDENGVSFYHNGIDTDPYLRAFFSNICARSSCYRCQFKKRFRVSDITIWDCFEADKIFPECDNDLGVTKMLIHTSKGKRIFDNISDKLDHAAVSAEDLLRNSKEMFESVASNPLREKFFDDAVNMPGKQLFAKYFPISASTRFEKTVRLMANKLGIYKYVRNFYKKLFGNRKR